MKFELTSTQSNFLINTSILLGGVYGTYRIFREQLRYDRSDMLFKSICVSGFWSSMLSSAWNLISKQRITDSNKGVAALTCVAALPLSITFLIKVDDTRRVRINSDEDGMLFTEASAFTAATAAATTIVHSGIANESTAGVSALAATATFPVALSFFNYRSEDSHYYEGLLKAAAASGVTAGAIALVATAARPKVGM